MRIKNQEERVLKMLLDLYTLTKDDWFYLSRIKIRESYNIGYNYSGIILENLFSKKKDLNNPKKYLYKWKTIKPNIHMVRKICEEARLYSPQKRKNQEAKVKNVVKNDNHNVSNKTISFFWGLLKISINK